MTKPNGGRAFPCTADEGQLGTCGMTLREYACIQLKVPDTNTPWLDEIIRRARREELAGQALFSIQLELANDFEPHDVNELAAIACQLADAVVAAADPQATWRKSTEGKP